jgi:hypothetical protein
MMEGSTTPCVTSESAWAYQQAKEGEYNSEGITPIERMIAGLFAVIQLYQVIAYAVSLWLKSDISVIVTRTLAVAHSLFVCALFIFLSYNPWEESIGEGSQMGPGFDVISIIILWILTCLYFINFKAVDGSEGSTFTGRPAPLEGKL